MSNARAIADVTGTLRQLVMDGIRADPDLGDITVTTVAPDRARVNGAAANQLNLFLYHVVPNGAWRNFDVPQQIRPGETRMPPLALTLHYLLTVYGRENDQQRAFSHYVLGLAMSVLHDHSWLLPDDIRRSVPAADLEDRGLDAQVERVRITQIPLSLDEMSKLWSGFQTQLRLSVAYEASVVLIDSAQAARAPLPVLTRGKDDSGPSAGGTMIPPFPTLSGIDDSIAELGARLKLSGHHLQGDRVVVIFQPQSQREPIRVEPDADSTASEVFVIIANDPARWVAGPYTVTVEITERPGTALERVRVSNVVQFGLAPKVLSSFPLRSRITAGQATVEVRCSPQVRATQYAALIVGDEEVVASPRSAPVAKLRFVIADPRVGEHFVRLRIDGIDSQLIDKSGGQLAFLDKKLRIS